MAHQRTGLTEAVATKRQYRGVPLEERRALRRERLIAAAADVYGELGYRNATVRSICQRAMLTERYFYEAFTSSEEILILTARSLASRMLGHMRELRDGIDGDPDAKTLRMLKGYFRSQHDEPSKARVFTLEFRGFSREADAEFERILDLFADLIVETRDPDRIGRAANDRLLRRGLIGALLHITVAWIDGGYREAVDAVASTGTLVCALADP